MAKRLPGSMATIIAALTILSVCHWTSADIDMQISYGWDGMYRFGRWTPVYITLFDPQASSPRSVRLEITSPHDSMFQMHLTQTLVVRDQRDTFVRYLPLTEDLQNTVAVVRDARSNEKLAEQSFLNRNPAAGFSSARGGQSGDLLIGVSGPRSAMQNIEGDFQPPGSTPQPSQKNAYRQAQALQVSYLEPKLLPSSRLGYEALNVLVLNAPNLLNMPTEAQQAVAAWVNAGGRLLFWAGDDLLPPDSPIVQMFPCRIGQSNTVKLSLADTTAAGLVPRLEALPSRELSGAPQARKTTLLNGKVDLWQQRVGLGQTAVMSVNGSQLSFISDKAAKDFWHPIIGQLAGQAFIQPPLDQSQPYDTLTNLRNNQAMAATSAIADRLGDVPGVGTFGFSYIAIVMIAMMLIVGPVDWLVLRKLGYQPWTWATTSFWIVAITASALLIGHMFRSGQLHYRSVRVIEQVDDKVVDGADMTGIYSPQTQNYRLACPPQSWWEPTRLEMYYGRGRSSRLNTIRFGQDQRGNHPRDMTVNIWNLNFMTGQFGGADAMTPPIEAKLKIGKAANRDHARITGRITNHSAATISHLFMDWNGCTPGVWGARGLLGVALAPGQSLTINADVAPGRAPTSESEDRNRYNNLYGNRTNPAERLLAACCGLHPERLPMTNLILQQEKNMVAIYALGKLPTAPVPLSNQNGIPAIEEHWQVVRALVKVEEIQ